MLEFDPTKRITVDQALRHSFLADFHTPGMEISVDRPLDAEVELLREAPENLKATVSIVFTAFYLADSHFFVSSSSSYTRLNNFDNLFFISLSVSLNIRSPER